jgi:sulfur-oxidizing protein SoxX
MAVRLLRLARLGAVAGIAAAGPATPSAWTQVAGYTVEGDGVPSPLDSRMGDPARGRRIVLDRTSGNCLICHVVPEPEERFMGDIGPDLTGVGSRLTVAQIRLRLIDAARLNGATVMPPYHRTDGLTRVGAPWRGRPVLGAREIEDVVAYLASLKDTDRGEVRRP